MLDINIVPLEADHLAQVGNWAPRDVAKTLLKLPGAPFTAPDSFGWAAIRDQKVLAIATIQFNKEHVAYLNCMVKPTEGGHGVGTQIIEYTLEQPAVKELVHLHALVDQDNTAAQKILETQGFSRVGYGPDTKLEFARHKH
jgi:RimJ/RimL family protein N-acetyltransferase